MTVQRVQSAATLDEPTSVDGVAVRSGVGVAVVGATVLASAVAALDANVVKVAVPAIGLDLHASVSALQ